MDLQFFFSFEGRINRALYWKALLALVILTFVFALLQFGLAVIVGDIIATALGGVVSIAMTFSTFVLGAKRLHDRDKCGWLQLIYVIPFLIPLPSILLEMKFLSLVAIALGLTIWIWLFVELGCLRGTVGPNHFGPDPLEQEANSVT
jgi:uncharacterized membrane protein YhaH (DUF805 family)